MALAEAFVEVARPEKTMITSQRLLLVVLLAGCQVQPPSNVHPPVTYPPDGGIVHLQPNDGGQNPVDGGTSVPVKPTITVDRTPTETIWPTVPIHGSTQNADFVVEDDELGSRSVPVQNDGRFCIDVPLKPETKNSIAFRAKNAKGSSSSVAPVETLQHGNPPDPAPPIPSINGAFLATVEHNGITNLGSSDDYVVDGDPATTFAFGAVLANHTPYVALTLRMQRRIDSVQVLSGDSRPNGFDVYLSNFDAPGPCGQSDNNYWTRVGGIGQTTGDDVVKFAATTTGHVCLALQGGGSWLHGYAIDELEVWTMPVPAQSPEIAPTCDNGG